HFCGIYAHKPSFGLFPFRGYNRPPNPPLPVSGDLGVIGPLGRSAFDLATALDTIAGPDEESEGTGYRLAFPPPRPKSLTEFRVLVIDGHPLVPMDRAVRLAIDRLAERLAKAGVKLRAAASCRTSRVQPGSTCSFWVRPEALACRLTSLRKLNPRPRL